MIADEIRARLQRRADRERAIGAGRYFKTGPGQYAAGDVFIGVSAPELRSLAKQYRHIAVGDALELLRSPVHEQRALALLILIHIFSKASEQTKKEIFNLYLNNTAHINNWDLVDLSAPHIIGRYLMDKARRPLHRLAKSKNLWERRIAIVATQWFIRNDDFADTLKISETLLVDKEDLIHKAVGWMLREVGKRDLKSEEAFLLKHYKRMPRTMLRYAIERLPEARRQAYLKGRI